MAASMHWEGEDSFIEITCLPDGRYHIRSAPKRESVFRPARPECVTDCPLDLIEKIYQLKGAQWLCDDICRDQDTSYVEYQVSRGVLSYATRESFKGARILDFGSGTGSSSIVIARMFPETEIIGVDLNVKSQEIAEATLEIALQKE